MLNTRSATSNRHAWRGRALFFWALGVSIVFWFVPITLTFIPSRTLQELGVLLAWAGVLPTLVLSILSVVFGSLGLRDARMLGGRGVALTGLIGGIGILVVPVFLGLAGIVAVMIGYGIIGLA